MILPLVTSKVQAGFPAPACDGTDSTLDLNAHLILRPAASFVVEIDGDSMVGAGIFPGDLAIVDKSLSPRNRDIVIAVIDGAFTVKRLLRLKDRVLLAPENDKYQPICLSDENDLVIWGVVTSVIRRIRKS